MDFVLCKNKHIMHHRKALHVSTFSVNDEASSDIASTVSINSQNCPCSPRPTVQSPASPERPSSHGSTTSGSSNGSSDTRSRSSDESRNDPAGDSWDSSKEKSFLSLHFVYIVVILAVLGYVCFFMLKMKNEVAESCKICDERVLLDPHIVSQVKKIPRYNDKIDYASDEYGAVIELHDTYYFKDSFGVGDLLRLPDVNEVSPNAMLKDNDECFAMRGHTGTFFIRLSRPIVVQSVTLVHNKEECDAAPKEFIIYGVKDPKEKVQVSLGRFQYENRGKLAQKFIIPRFAEIGYIGMKIVSNWGNKQYTCITKIKVHGEPQD
uniref:SUN domain-containing protein 3 n=1 Tax=Cacopsylla melanoneura TaxID=428564 RepID=A0A8D9BQN2_9HEMI